MPTSIYKEALSELLVAINGFRSKNISLESYRSEVYRAENAVVSLEERPLRSMLMNHENELELIRSTTGSLESIEAEVERLREALNRWL